MKGGKTSSDIDKLILKVYLMNICDLRTDLYSLLGELRGGIYRMLLTFMTLSTVWYP